MEGGEERQEEEEEEREVGRRRHSRSTPSSMCREGQPSVTSKGLGRGRGRGQMQRSKTWEKRRLLKVPSSTVGFVCFFSLAKT